MPELPEVETVVRTLEHQLGNAVIKECRVLWDKIIGGMPAATFMETIRGKQIQGYGRLGKYLMFDLGTHMWIVHLRMEGKFYVQPAKTKYDRHTHVLFVLEDGRELHYHDTRKFGRMYLYEKAAYKGSYPCFAHTGYDVFDKRVQADYLYRLLHSRKITLKQALLDQQVMAGIGNIYANEICFAMRMHPETKIYRLRKKDFVVLLQVSRSILQKAIAAGGTTIRSYTSSLGVDGRFQLELEVHGKEGEECSVCRTLIRKITVGGRGTYYCPTCQRKR